MRSILILFVLICALSTISFGQNKKPFIGMLEYKVTIRDTSLRSLVPDNSMMLYSNDTISRMENHTHQLGKQVVLRHMELNKSYILIDSPIGKFAIKMVNSDTTNYVSKYTFKKKMWKRKVLGLKAKRLEVNHPAFDEPIEFLYLKKFDNKYLNNFDEAPGLLVRYSVVTPDGVMDYELVRFSEYSPNRDLFGVPSDYQKVTIDEFMDQMLAPPSNGEQDN